MGRKILVVDDEPVLVETIAYNLEQAGYQVTTAADGASALEAARRETPDLVILDIMLPEMDGLGSVASCAARTTPSQRQS